MENEETLEFTTTEETDSFGVEIGKALVISAATTVGMVAGIAVIGAVKTRIDARRERKAAQNLATNLPAEA